MEPSGLEEWIEEMVETWSPNDRRVEFRRDMEMLVRIAKRKAIATIIRTMTDDERRKVYAECEAMCREAASHGTEYGTAKRCADRISARGAALMGDTKDE